jgi:hypothetical protein
MRHASENAELHKKLNLLTTQNKTLVSNNMNNIERKYIKLDITLHLTLLGKQFSLSIKIHFRLDNFAGCTKLL